MTDKTARMLVKVFVMSNPIGRAIWEEAASFNRGVGFAMAKDLMDGDGLHSYHVDEFLDFLRKDEDRRNRNCWKGFNNYYKNKH